MLAELEYEARKKDLFLRLKVAKIFGIYSSRTIVAKRLVDGRLKLLGEMKSWCFKSKSVLNLDTMRVFSRDVAGIGNLIWTSTMAWALEETQCRYSRLLAINDEKFKHKCLVRYFRQRGFTPVHEVKSQLSDLPLRLIWGGEGTLMIGNCEEIFAISKRRWVD